MLYDLNCRPYHGRIGDKGSSIPNLTHSSEGTFGIMVDIVLKSMYLLKGMPVFSGRITQAELMKIKGYILHSTN